MLNQEDTAGNIRYTISLPRSLQTDVSEASSLNQLTRKEKRRTQRLLPFLGSPKTWIGSLPTQKKIIILTLPQVPLYFGKPKPQAVILLDPWPWWSRKRGEAKVGSNDRAGRKKPIDWKCSSGFPAIPIGSHAGCEVPDLAYMCTHLKKACFP